MLWHVELAVFRFDGPEITLKRCGGNAGHEEISSVYLRDILRATEVVKECGPIDKVLHDLFFAYVRPLLLTRLASCFEATRWER